jgi:hypothetical protein
LRDHIHDGRRGKEESMKAPEEDRRRGGETTQAKTGRLVYGFSDDLGSADLLALCGGKGSGLMRMRGLGLSVPEGFVFNRLGEMRDRSPEDQMRRARGVVSYDAART